MSSCRKFISLKVWGHGIIIAIAFLAGQTVAEELTLTWTTRANDLEVAETTISSSPLVSTHILFARTSLKKFRVGVIRAIDFGSQRATVKGLCSASQATLCINANFFDESGDPLGLVVSRAILHNRLHPKGSTLTGVFQVTRRGLSIVQRDQFLPKYVVEAVQAGPRLITEGKPIPGLKESSSLRRSGICIDTENRLVFFQSSSSWWGLGLDRLQEVLISPEVGCRDALNLDGGGSAQLYITAPTNPLSPEISPIDLPGTDEVPIALGLFPHAP